MKGRPLINQFNVGEVSPLIDARNDVQKYYGACRRLENMIPLIQGGARRRPGTYYVAASKYGNKKSRLFGFHFSTIQAYMTEFGDEYLRIFRDKGQVIWDDATDFNAIQTITTLENSASAGSNNDYRVTNICIHGDYLWFNYGKKVYKYSLTNYSLIATYTCDAGLNYWKDILVDDNYIYLLTHMFGTHVYRYSVSDGSYVDYVTLSNTYGAGNMAQDDDYIYVGMTYTLLPLHISKVDKATWTASNVGSTVSQYSANLLSLYDGYLFYVSGSALYPPTGLTKISVPDGILVWRDEHIIGTTYYPLNANLSVYGTIGLIVSYDAAYDLGRGLIELDLSTSDPTYKIRASEAGIYEVDVVWEDEYTYWVVEHEESEKIRIKKYINIYEIATPFTEDELFELSFAQSADTLYIAHPSHKPMELTRTDHTAWTLNYRTFKYGDDRDITNASQANPVVITSVAHGLEVNQWVKFSGIVGMTELNDQYGKITAVTDDTFTIGAIDSSLYGAYTTGGVAQLLEFKGTKKAITAATAAKPVEITCVDHGLADGDLVWIDKVIGMIELNNRVFTVANKTDDTFELTDGAGADIDGSGYTAYVSGGYETPTIFTAVGDYPGCVAFFEQRLVYAGSDNQPQTLWPSESGAYDTFNITQSGDDVAIEYTLASERVDRIMWLINQEYLIVGTVGGVYKFGATTTSDPLTQTNVNAKRQITYGVKEFVPAKLVGDSILYVQTGGRTVRDLYYTINKPSTEGGYNAGNLTAMAEHIAKGATEALSGITDMDYQQEPFSILLCARADGQLLFLVYDREQQLVGWARQWTGDPDEWDVIESVGVINNGEMENEVWISVKRTIGGTDYRYIEYFKPQEFFSEIKDCFFVDSGLTWDGGDPVAISDITKANPAVVTVASWPANGAGTDLTDGDEVCIYGVAGMTEVNIDRTTAYTVANSNKGALTFELSGIDSSAYTAYDSGGYVKIVTNAISSGLDHLDGRTVDILVDGEADTQQDVTTGALPSALSWYGNLIHVGLPYAPYLKPMKPEAGLQQGTTQGMLGRTYHLHLSVFESYGVKVGEDEDSLYEIPELNEDTPSLCTGYYDTAFDGTVGKDLDMLITNEGPYPLTVRAIVPEMEKFP